MANRERRGNREKRKPKAEKSKSPVQGSSFAPPQAIGTSKRNARKKER